MNRMKKLLKTKVKVVDEKTYYKILNGEYDAFTGEIHYVTTVQELRALKKYFESADLTKNQRKYIAQKHYFITEYHSRFMAFLLRLGHTVKEGMQ